MGSCSCRFIPCVSLGNAPIPPLHHTQKLLFSQRPAERFLTRHNPFRGRAALSSDTHAGWTAIHASPAKPLIEESLVQKKSKLSTKHTQDHPARKQEPKAELQTIRLLRLKGPAVRTKPGPANQPAPPPALGTAAQPILAQPGNCVPRLRCAPV